MESKTAGWHRCKSIVNHIFRLYANHTNMKRITLLIFLFATTLFSSCVQRIIDGTKNNTTADFLLRLNIEQNDGSIRQQVNTATNIPGAAEANAVLQVKESKVQMRLGGIQFSPNVPMTLSSNLVFQQASRPEQIAGEYNLPADANKLLLSMGWIQQGVLHTYAPAIRGKVIVRYNANTNTWSGELQGIAFEKPVNATYKAIELSGTFNHVPLQ